MTATDIVDSLHLPGSCTVNRRVPKKLLLEHGAPTAADRRALQDGIEEVSWVAVLKPSTIGVPTYRDESREYLEIAVLRAALRPGAKERRLVELLHRAIPYPLVLFVEGNGLSLSLAHKRWSLNEVNTAVLDGEVKIVEWVDVVDSPFREPFLDALGLERLPHQSLLAMYDGLMDVVHALEAARVTGIFAMPTSAELATIRRTALTEYRELSAESERLRAAAARERQTARLVALNLELKKIEADTSAVRARL